jgi:3-hydroxyacyl-CoA dehydrogenase
MSDLAGRLGKTMVRVGDRAGFVVNALLLPYLNGLAAMHAADGNPAFAPPRMLAARAAAGLSFRG